MKKTSDAQFLDKRRRFVRTWNLVGTALLAALAALTAWLFTASPSLVNPPQVAAEIARGALPQSTLELMAGLLPVVVLMLLGVTALVVMVGFAVVATERRYLRIIEDLQTRG